MKDSFFTRAPAKLRTMADVNAKLAERTGKPVCGSSAGEVIDPGPCSATPGPAEPSIDVGSEGNVSPAAPVEGVSADKEGLNTYLDVPSTAEPLTVPATPAVLVWNIPVKATQTSQDGRYEIRGARLKESLLYYAWSLQKPVPKLLGYPPTPEAARKLCQAHADAL